MKAYTRNHGFGTSTLTVHADNSVTLVHENNSKVYTIHPDNIVTANEKYVVILDEWRDRMRFIAA